MELEKYVKSVITEFGDTIDGDSKIVQKYGEMCYGIDHVLYLDSATVFIQDKWEHTAPKLSAINHFINAVSNTNISGPRYLVFISKIPVTKRGKTLMSNSGIINISSIDFETIGIGLREYVKSIIDNKFSFRDHQISAISKYNYESGIICHPTGSGKTITAFGIVKKHTDMKRGNVLWLTQRKDVLYSQFTENKIELYKSIVPDLKIILGYDELIPDIHDDTLYVVNIDKLKTGSVYKKMPSDKFGLIILDECHCLGADLTYEMIRYFDAVVIGFSATPIRTEPEKYQRSADVFGDGFTPRFIDKISLFDAIERRLIVPPNFHWLEVSGRGRVEKNRLLGFINDKIALSYSRKGIAYADSKDSADEWYDLINVTKSSYDELSQYAIYISHTGRECEIHKFTREDSYAIIICVGRCKEGFDHERVDFIINLDPVIKRSSLVFTQQVGRAMRVWKDKPRGIIIDTFTLLDEEDKISQICTNITKFYNYLNWIDSPKEKHGGDDFQLEYDGDKLAHKSGITFDVKIKGEHSIDWDMISDKVRNMISRMESSRTLTYSDIKIILRDKKIRSLDEYSGIAKRYGFPEEPYRVYNKFNWADYLSLEGYYQRDECISRLRDLFPGGLNPFNMSKNIETMSTDPMIPPFDFIADYYNVNSLVDLLKSI